MTVNVFKHRYTFGISPGDVRVKQSFCFVVCIHQDFIPVSLRIVNTVDSQHDINFL